MTHSKPRERDSFRDFRDTGYLSKNPRDIYVGHCSVNLLEYWISSTDVRGYRVGKLLPEGNGTFRPKINGVLEI